MKRFIMLTFGLLMCLSSSALAIDESIALTSIGNEEFSEVINAVYNDEFINNANILAKSGQENFVMGYKLYYISAKDFDYLTNEDSNIEEILPNEYLWLITTKSGVEIKVALEDNNWKVIGYKSPAYDISEETLVAKETFAATQIEHIDSFTVLEIPEYHSRFFCYQQNNMNYAVPVNTRPDLTGLNNNEAYPLAVVNDVFQANEANYTEQMYGGITIDNVNSESEENNYHVIYYMMVLACTCIAYAVIRKNKAECKE